MKFSIKIFLILLIIFSQNLFGRTRTQVIEEANNYRIYSWIVGKNNILDVKTNASGKSGSDGIDDRMGWVYDANTDTTNWAAMRANWPFKPEDKVTGEAYAWAGWVGNIQWGGDTTNLFSQRLKDSVNKWIAGAREEDCHTTNIQKIKAKYKGYTGIDCSGFKISGVLL